MFVVFLAQMDICCRFRGGILYRCLVRYASLSSVAVSGDVCSCLQFVVLLTSCPSVNVNHSQSKVVIACCLLFLSLLVTFLMNFSFFLDPGNDGIKVLIRTDGLV